MDDYHFAEFGKHVLRVSLPFSSQKADCVITDLIITIDNAPTYVSNKMKQFFAYYNIKHATGISHNPTGQAVIERANHTLKEMLIKQKVRVKSSGTD